MKSKFFAAFFIAVSVAAFASAQDTENKQEKKRRKQQPKLAVVKLEEPPPPIVPIEQPKPANGSLFSENATNGNLLGDFKARRVGDLVFVDVVETNVANVSSGASRKRDSGTVGGIVTAAGALPVPGAAVAGTIVGALGNRKFEGSGNTQRRSDVRSRITARVVEVLPNGDLRIEALKLVRINKETEQLGLTGIVRTSDIERDNSIPTILVGDLRVDFNGKGVASQDNAPGWLYRLFEKVTPF